MRIFTLSWLSFAVTKVRVRSMGIDVLRSMTASVKSPTVPKRSVCGVTSSRYVVVLASKRASAWIAAPKATTRSGSTSMLGSRWK